MTPRVERFPSRPSPTATHGKQLLAEFLSYADAERAVERLEAAGLPIGRVNIVQTDLRPSDVSRRFTVGRAAPLSAGWVGLLAGLLLGHYTPDSAWLGVLLSGLLIGATWGALFGYVAHALAHSRQTSAAPPARRYAVYVGAGAGSVPAPTQPDGSTGGSTGDPVLAGPGRPSIKPVEPNISGGNP